MQLPSLLVRRAARIATLTVALLLVILAWSIVLRAVYSLVLCSMLRAAFGDTRATRSG